MLRNVECGDLPEAAAVLQLIDAQASLPNVCNAELLASLQKARSLLIVRRASLVRRLRSLRTRQPYTAACAPVTPTWQLDG